MVQQTQTETFLVYGDITGKKIKKLKIVGKYHLKKKLTI